MQRAFGWRVGRFLSVGARSVYPAVGTVARQTVAPRAVLVGNAAQTLHPIGAQGFNLGLRSEEHTSELQSLMRISYAVFCLKKKNKNTKLTTITVTNSYMH